MDDSVTMHWATVTRYPKITVLPLYKKDPSASLGMTMRGGARLTFIIFRSADLCLCEALYPALLARPFFKVLLSCHAISENPIHR